MKINFIKGQWEDKLQYAYTYRFKPTLTVKQEKDHIRNRKDKSKEFGCDYENISLFLKDKYATGTTMKATCSFDNYGAPLICLAEDLVKQKDGTLRFGNYYEVVIYEQGVNVWDLKYDGKKVTYYKMAGFTFNLASNKKHKIVIQFKNNRLYIKVGKHTMQVGLPNAKENYYWGIDLCEGINRFYDLEINKGE